MGIRGSQIKGDEKESETKVKPEEKEKDNE